MGIKGNRENNSEESDGNVAVFPFSYSHFRIVRARNFMRLLFTTFLDNSEHDSMIIVLLTNSGLKNVK